MATSPHPKPTKSLTNLQSTNSSRLFLDLVVFYEIRARNKEIFLRREADKKIFPDGGAILS